MTGPECFQTSPTPLSATAAMVSPPPTALLVPELLVTSSAFASYHFPTFFTPGLNISYLFIVKGTDEEVLDGWRKKIQL